MAQEIWIKSPRRGSEDISLHYNQRAIVKVVEAGEPVEAVEAVEVV
jgi:hypothetical protein